MTKPTHRDILDACSALDDLCINLEMGWRTHPRKIQELRSTVLKAILNLSQPTMADVEWDPDTHCFAEAQHCDHGPVIMLNLMSSGRIECAVRNDNVTTFFAEPIELVPTGRRLIFAEGD